MPPHADVAQNHEEIPTAPKKYYCEFTDRPFGLPKHIVTIVWEIKAHIFAAIGIYKLFNLQYLPVIPFLFLYVNFVGIGTTAGAHRLWTHRSFKANLPLRVLLALMHTAGVHYPLFKWCRDHRLHHKYVDAFGDPHTPKDGFFHAHIGWLFKPDYPGFKEKENTIDLSDLDNDPVVRFQAKYYYPLAVIMMFIIPMTCMHLICPQMPWIDVFFINYVWYIFQLHMILASNSFSHVFGWRPYDKNIESRQNLLIMLCGLGEGWHNYHHAFPDDYKNAELGIYRFNVGAMAIDFFAMIGWAYDLKSMPPHVVKNRVLRTGDGTHDTYTTAEKLDEKLFKEE